IRYRGRSAGRQGAVVSTIAYMTSVGSPTLLPPHAYTSKSIETVPQVLSRRVGREAEGDRRAGGLLPQLRGDAALNDAELRLSAVRDDDGAGVHAGGGRRAAVDRLEAIARAPRPAQRPLHRLAHERGIGRVREALVECHRHVRPELRLD